MKKVIVLSILLGSCAVKGNYDTTRDVTPLFELLSSETTGVDFSNTIQEAKDFNVFNYRNFYNGGGVALGDINNDGLADMFLVSNLGINKLFLNKGDLRFEDITEHAGVGGKKAWSTGVTFADVNGDGNVDIYVCNAGVQKGDDRANELYINNGDLTFSESASEYGLDDHGFSTHAAFFDYDKDGDLDMYLLNNSFIPISRLQYANIRDQRDRDGGHKFFRNDGGKFTDISEQAGIYGSVIGFGLGITVGDVNNDNWMDIYVSNDFYERDYLYINNTDGTFTEASKEWMQHESLSSMGADIADINNDGCLDIFVTDMLPGNDHRLKTTSAFEGYDLFQLKLSRDFHYQYMQNMLHLNNGNNTFSEVARMAGVHATDWSWGALMFDMNNDGLKDIFVANGIAKNLTDQDFVNYLNEDKSVQSLMAAKAFDPHEILKNAKAEPLSDYAFINKGNLQFENHSKELGLGEPGFSNGAAYGDLDNDGDLDLVVNTNNSPVRIFRNTQTKLHSASFLGVILKGDAPNVLGVGAKVKVYQPGRQQLLQQMPNRGFESSVDFKLLFGLGNLRVDSITVAWPDDRTQTLNYVPVNKYIILSQKDAVKPLSSHIKEKGLPSLTFEDITRTTQLNYEHVESDFVDYNRDRMLKQSYATLGPAIAAGDVNNDDLDDIYVGGAAGSEKILYLQTRKGTFIKSPQPAFNDSNIFEDTDALFFDADDDNDLDLYVVTGSNEFSQDAPELVDRLYINDGHGKFTHDTRLPDLRECGSSVSASDFDLDGDLDLFVGGRLVPGKYGIDPQSFLLINDGTGGFKNYTKRYLDSNELGMVTASVWADLDNDHYPELILAGDWMPITIFKNEQGHSLIKTEIPNSSGWWNEIRMADLDGDGDDDFILGNAGLNNRYRTFDSHVADMYSADFGNNGAIKQIITSHDENGELYPMVLKGELQQQVPPIKKKFLKYADYANKRIEEVFSNDELNKASVKHVQIRESIMLINDGNFKFDMRPLPREAQISSIHSIQTIDCNDDNIPDLVLNGNFYDALPEMGRDDASYGVVLKGNKDLNYKVMKFEDTGFFSVGQVRNSVVVRNARGEQIIVLAKNNAPVQVLKVNREVWNN